MATLGGAHDPRLCRLLLSTKPYELEKTTSRMHGPATGQGTEGGIMTEETAVAIPDNAPTPSTMLMLAVQRGASIEQMQQLMDLQERHERNEARKAFVVALNAFKADPPEILKSRQVDFTSQKGRTHYKHAGLDNASELIGAALAEHGISHRWNVEQTGPKIKVTCILTHALGHSESVTMEASPDESGNKNSIQAIGSAVSYLQRYTLFAASGIAPKNVDDDGRGGVGVREMDPRVKEDFAQQIAQLEDLKAADALWATIASECTKAGDVPAYDELKAAMAAKRKTVKRATEGAV